MNRVLDSSVSGGIEYLQHGWSRLQNSEVLRSICPYLKTQDYVLLDLS